MTTRVIHNREKRVDYVEVEFWEGETRVDYYKFRCVVGQKEELIRDLQSLVDDSSQRFGEIEKIVVEALTR